MKSCFEGHKRRRIYHPHKSLIISVILFPFFSSFSPIRWCSATPGGERGRLGGCPHRRPANGWEEEEEEELEGRAVPVGEI